MEKLIPLEFKNQRIMTTKVLAEEFGTNEKNISRNFTRNEERFIEGKHYFKLEGEELKEFKGCGLKDESLKYVSILYLWTDKGAARHAKILETDEAWQIYEDLEDTYFKVQELKQAQQLISSKEEILELKSTLEDLKRATEEAKHQYKPSHKKKLDYNRLIKSVVNSDEEAKVVKDWCFGLLGITKWEDTCIDDSKRILEVINTVARLLTIKKIEQITFLQ